MLLPPSLFSMHRVDTLLTSRELREAPSYVPSCRGSIMPLHFQFLFSRQSKSWYLSIKLSMLKPAFRSTAEAANSPYLLAACFSRSNNRYHFAEIRAYHYRAVSTARLQDISLIKFLGNKPLLEYPDSIQCGLEFCAYLVASVQVWNAGFQGHL